MSILRTALTFVLFFAVAMPLVAKDKAPKKEAQPITKTFPFLEGLTLTDDQKAKIDDIAKEYAPKQADLAKKSRDLLTPEQQQARGQAEKDAKAAGKTGRDLAAAVDAALKLTDEQKAKQADVRKEMGALAKERQDKVIAVLTPEQKDQNKDKLPKTGGKGKKNK